MMKRILTACVAITLTITLALLVASVTTEHTRAQGVSGGGGGIVVSGGGGGGAGTSNSLAGFALTNRPTASGTPSGYGTVVTWPDLLANTQSPTNTYLTTPTIAGGQLFGVTYNPTNIYTNTTATFSGVSGSHVFTWTGTAHGLKYGDQFLVKGTSDQYTVDGITNGNNTIGVHVSGSGGGLSSSYTSQQIVVYGAVAYLNDVDPNQQGAIMSDAGYALRGQQSGNSGNILFLMGDDTIGMTTGNNASVGNCLVIGPMYGGSRGSAFQLYSGAFFNSLMILPGGFVSFQWGVTNFAGPGNPIPFYSNIKFQGTNGIETHNLQVDDGPILQQTNAQPAGITITAGTVVASTNKIIWLTITNGGLSYSVQAFKN